MDKAGKDYWDNNWGASPTVRPVVPHEESQRTYVDRMVHKYFTRIFSSLGQGTTLLEVGCGRSPWLPYFATEFGFQVSGLDYSEVGCRQTEQILAENGIDGHIVCSDMFTPPEEFVEKFDVVYSGGVVEHFEDTAEVIRAIARYARPGGLVVTTIPNMVGMLGSVQKLLNRPVYDIHIPLSAEDLGNGHAAAGLDVLECEYYLFMNFWAVNMNGIPQENPARFFREEGMKFFGRLTNLSFRLEERLGSFRSNRVTSPYIYCVARKPVVTQ